MKFRIIIAISFLFFNFLGSAQQTHWANPRPTGIEINDIMFFDSEHGFMTGVYGTALVSSNGGVLWESVETNCIESLLRIYPLGGGEALVSSSVNLYRINDFGHSWSFISSLSDLHNLRPTSIDMIDAQIGYGMNSKNLLKTIDGGNSWFVVQGDLADILQSEEIRGLDFVDENTGLIFSWSDNNNDGRIFRTVNGGANCAPLEYSFKNKVQKPVSIAGLNDSTYLLLCSTFNGKNTDITFGTEVIKTTDFGENWINTFRGIDQGLYFLPERMNVFLDSLIYVCGTMGQEQDNVKMISSFDVGNTWELNTSVLLEQYGNYSMKAVEVVNTNKAFAFYETNLSHDLPPIFVTTSNHLNWEPVYSNYRGDIYNVLFSKDEMSALTQDGILFSTDYFESFDEISLPEISLDVSGQSDALSVIAISGNDSLGFLIAKNNVTQWNKYNTDIVGFKPVSIEVPNDRCFYVFGDRDGYLQIIFVYNFNSGNVSVKEINLPDGIGDIENVSNFCYENGTIYVFYKYFGYYASSDHGKTWENKHLEFLDYKLSKGLVMDDSMVYVSNYNEIFRFKDGDPSTAEQIIPNWLQTGLQDIDEFIVLDDGRVAAIAAGYWGVYYLLTKNKNDEWKKIGLNQKMQKLCYDPFYDAVWIYGGNCLLYLGDGLPVGIEPIPTHSEQKAFSIEGNPFSNSLQISINLEFQGEATLQLTDMNGKIVRQSKIMLHGRASRFLIQTHDLAPGAYVCTLVAGGESFSDIVIKQ